MLPMSFFSSPLGTFRKKMLWNRSGNVRSVGRAWLLFHWSSSSFLISKGQTPHGSVGQGRGKPADIHQLEVPHGLDGIGLWP